MLILTLRTDKPESEIGWYQAKNQIAYHTWTAHRQLAETIHQELLNLLKSQDKDWLDLEGLVIFKGPGSYTGLRIGMSVANALATSLDIPIVATNDENWQESGIKKLMHSGNEKQVIPDYGAPAYVSSQKK